MRISVSIRFSRIHKFDIVTPVSADFEFTRMHDVYIFWLIALTIEILVSIQSALFDESKQSGDSFLGKALENWNLMEEAELGADIFWFNFFDDAIIILFTQDGDLSVFDCFDCFFSDFHMILLEILAFEGTLAEAGTAMVLLVLGPPFEVTESLELYQVLPLMRWQLDKSFAIKFLVIIIFESFGFLLLQIVWLPVFHDLALFLLVVLLLLLVFKILFFLLLL